MSKLITEQVAFLVPGTPCSYGCEPEALPEWIELATQLGTRKRIVAVSDWQWWDLDYSESEIASFYRALGFEPVLLYTDNVLVDTSGKFNRGNWVLTTELKTLHRNTIFETRNSLYLLVGKGTRKKIDPQLVQKIF